MPDLSQEQEQGPGSAETADSYTICDDDLIPGMDDCEEMSPLFGKEDASGCMGARIRTSSGYIDLLNPHPADIKIDDIAVALSRQPRFTGHTSGEYSVAMHSVNCAILAQKRGLSLETQFACLLHDAAEAYTGDINKPLKRILAPLLSPIEQSLERAIAAAFKVDFDFHREAVKKIDWDMLVKEKRGLAPWDDKTTWPGEEQAEEVDLELEPDCHQCLVQWGFLAVFNHLKGKLGL